jgi:hypothetical protein
MRRTRFMTLMFLVLSLAFLGVEEFRWAMNLPLLMASESTGFGWAQPSSDDLRAFGDQAERSGDAAALAYSALHPGVEDDDLARRRADEAVARDPQYTWVYYHLATRHGARCRDAATAERVRAWAARLNAWDPENAIGPLLEAECLRDTIKDWPRGIYFPKTGDPPHKEFLRAQTGWLATMDRGYRRPRYDSYSLRRFELERRVLSQQGWAKPLVMLLSVAAYPMPNLLNIRDYANYQVHVVGREAEQARRLEEALAHYRKVAAFGLRMRLGGRTLFEQLLGFAVEGIADESLLPALKRAGRADEAALLEAHIQERERAMNLFQGKDPLALSSGPYWTALLTSSFLGLVLLFGLLTVVCTAYVNAKRWFRPEKRGRLYQVMTVAENYVPVLLFLSCLGLFLSYAPYASNFRYYMTASGDIGNLEPLFYNVMPLWIILPRMLYLPVERPFGTYFYWAAGALLFVVLLAGWQEWRARRAA